MFFLTLRPLYGTTCAPIRWFNGLAQNFANCGFVQAKTDPCVFRLELGTAVAGVCVVHVGDISATASVAGKKKFEAPISTFNHIGVTMLGDNQSLTYLGIEIVRPGKQYRFSEGRICKRQDTTGPSGGYSAKRNVRCQSRKKKNGHEAIYWQSIVDKLNANGL